MFAMKHTRQRKSFAVFAGIVILSVVLAACGSANTGSGSNTPTASGNNGKGCKNIGVLLPETATSARWDGEDRPDLLKDIPQALPGAHVDYNNAEGNSTEQQNQAEADLTKGDCILVVAPNDSQAAAAIVAKAKGQGVPVISYDRLIYSNDLNYYVSFDGVAVGNLQGQYIVQNWKKYAHGASHVNLVMINGAKTDNNALLFNKGAMQALQPLISNGTFKLVYSIFTPNWDNPTAQTEMEQALTANQNNVQIAYVANDGMAGTVIAALSQQKLNGKVLVTGQDATVAGFQQILLGNQAMTVYKAINKEAMATAQLVAAISNGTSTSSIINGQTTVPITGGANIPSVLETPVAVDISNITSTVLADGFVTKAQICAPPVPAGAGGIC
ncbi:MAG TPA: substrate-binding domain-containing protein [Ktedonobacteraceae bacterium]|nr:substrate-binding domain-containing protein [Ktedonobacteraceae bacterium]